MHVHQSIWSKGKPLFAGNQYADLSENALFYIGGIIKHAKSLNAFTNLSTNSYSASSQDMSPAASLFITEDPHHAGSRM